jgi:hypothetical protein
MDLSNPSDTPLLKNGKIPKTKNKTVVNKTATQIMTINPNLDKSNPGNDIKPSNNSTDQDIKSNTHVSKISNIKNKSSPKVLRNGKVTDPNASKNQTQDKNSEINIPGKIAIPVTTKDDVNPTIIVELNDDEPNIESVKSPESSDSEDLTADSGNLPNTNDNLLDGEGQFTPVRTRISDKNSDKFSRQKSADSNEDAPRVPPVIYSDLPKEFANQAMIYRTLYALYKGLHIKNIKQYHFGFLIFPADIHSFNMLLNTPPSHSFGAHKIKIRAFNERKNSNNKSTPPSVIIKNVRLDVDLDDLKAQFQLDGYNIQYLARIISYTTGKPTPMVRLILQDSAQAEQLITQGYNYLFYHFTAEKSNPIAQAKQCFKCQSFGHESGICQADLKCVRCSGPHYVTDCVKQKFDTTCANCQGAHAACARACPSFKIANREATILLNQKIQANLASKQQVVPAAVDFPAMQVRENNLPAKTITGTAKNNQRSYADAASLQGGNKTPKNPLVSFKGTKVMENIMLLMSCLIQTLEVVGVNDKDIMGNLNAQLYSLKSELRSLNLYPQSPDPRGG